MCNQKNQNKFEFINYDKRVTKIFGKILYFKINMKKVKKYLI